MTPGWNVNKGQGGGRRRKAPPPSPLAPLLPFRGPVSLRRSRNCGRGSNRSFSDLRMTIYLSSGFPVDFIFQLTEEEFSTWKSQIVISRNEQTGLSKKASGMSTKQLMAHTIQIQAQLS